jgi:hypothetical protein
VAQLGRDGPWNPQDANSNCSTDADRHAKSHSENTKQPFFANGARMRFYGLHAFGLSDSAAHNKSKSTGRDHAGVDLALPAVQLAIHY